MIIDMYPENNAYDISIDTELIIKLDENAKLTNKGYIKVFDCEDDSLVDLIDLSIADGPNTPSETHKYAKYIDKPYVYENKISTNKNTTAGTISANYEPDNRSFQLSIIGSFSDGFHFHPVIIHDNIIKIQIHHNLLEPNHKYYVTIEDAFVPNIEIKKNEWTFETKNVINKERIIVSKNKGDYRTIQGAIDSIPNYDKRKHYIYIENGDYEELVYFRCKKNIIIEGESKDNVIIHYPNNEVFNPHPPYLRTNEERGTFPSRRAAFSCDNCSNITFNNLTIKTDLKGQAEGLLINGENNYLKNVRIIGSGDALQANGHNYFEGCEIIGDGDTILGRGANYFKDCYIKSSGPFMWIRNDKSSHGNIFVDCYFEGVNGEQVIARFPDNNNRNYPDAECVLINCKLKNVAAIGFDPVPIKAQTVNLLEYLSTDFSNNLIDISKRCGYVRQIDEKTKNYYCDWNNLK